MTLRSICLSCALVLVGGAGVACGSDDSPNKGSTPYSSGVPGSKTFDTLTDADLSNLCAALRNRITNDPGLRDATCHFAGFGASLAASVFGTATDADLQKTCTDIEANCKSTPPTSEQSTCTKPAGTCTATVAEFDACVTDFLGAVSNAFAAFPACSSITASTLSKLISSGGSGTMPMTVAPASCQTLEQKCPGVQNSTGLGSVTQPMDSGQ